LRIENQRIVKVVMAQNKENYSEMHTHENNEEDPNGGAR